MHALLLLCLLGLLSGCTTALEESVASSPKLDTGSFFPREPSVRSFAYSRLAPDGSRLVGVLSIEVLRVVSPDRRTPGVLMEAAVDFRAEGIAFSPEQARAIGPTGDWPDDRGRYPMTLPGVSEQYGFLAVMATTDGNDPGELAVFWSSGILNYLGMSRKPSDFALTAVEQGEGDDAPVSVKGAFKDGHATVGIYHFTFRRQHGLTGISATLRDSTRIDLVEQPAGQPPREEQRIREPRPRREGVLLAMDAR